MILSPKRGYFWIPLITLSLLGYLTISANNNTQFVVLAQVSSKRPVNEKMRQLLTQELKLTDAQQKQIIAIRNKYRNSIEHRTKELQKTEEQLKQLMSSTASVDVIYAKHSEFKRLTEELENLRFNVMLEVREVLTTSQRARVSQIMEKHRQKFRQMTDRPPEF